MTRSYAEVIGDPIAHSKSPLIHNFWLQKLGIDAEYRAKHVRADELEDYFAQRRKDADWRGCNVTIPHKVAVRSHLDTVSREASVVGAVNCVYVQQGRLIGENTDVDGVLEALPESLMSSGSEICLLGTGGAARAALAACKLRDVSIVMFSARNREAAQRLQSEFGFGGCVADLISPHNLQTADVVINTTPLGMTGMPEMPAELLSLVDALLPHAVVFDMVYAPLETSLLARARRNGNQTVDGLAMLIGQAAEAFRLFFGMPAPREYDTELRAMLIA